jgi:hypothetical protein
VTFCSMFPSGVDDPIDSLQFVFGEAMPLSISSHTFRYPGFVASYEKGDSGIAFHGARATLIVNEDGCRLYSNRTSAPLVEAVSKDPAIPFMAHWANFLECLRTRRKPVSDIETCVRSTVTSLLADIAHRYSTTLDWDEKTFTTKQSERVAV